MPSEQIVSITSAEVLARIARDDHSWESMVPVAVAQIIKSRRLFREKKRRCFKREPPKSRDVTGSITATLRAVLDFAST